jgi:chromate reductase, NAD(P)H dehydrogenase (quinone)
MKSAKSSLINILAIPGSLRPNSSNHAVIRAVQSFMTDNVILTVYDGLATLPHFDDNKEPVDSVIKFRRLIAEADGVLISSPEYAFGVPGSLKNALDWTVSSGELVNKPLALITAATGGDKAHAALLLTFQALSAQIPPGNQLLISFVRAKMNVDGAISDPVTLNNIKRVTESLIETIINNEQ